MLFQCLDFCGCDFSLHFQFHSFYADTFEIRYALRHCEIAEYDRYTTFSCHNEPTYLLSRECTNEYYQAAGICCKVDESIHYLVNSRPDFFARIKYMLHSDDYTYWRPEQVLKWLAAVDNSGAGQYPLIANVQVGDDNNAGVWMVDTCKEIHTTGWYQPTMLNHALLARMAVGAMAYGNRDVCSAFTISQDIGIGIFAWMYQANHIQMPGVEMNSEHHGADIFKPDQVAVHFVKHIETDRCDGRKDNNWPTKDRYNQDMVIGCGDIGKPIVGHDKAKRADMYDAWEYFKTHGKDIVLNTPGVNEFIEGLVVVNATGHTLHFLTERQPVALQPSQGPGEFQVPTQGVMLMDEVTMYTPAAGEKIVKKVIPRLMPMRGYRGTKHSKENDITKKWKVFGLKDCSPPGKHG